MKVLLVFGYEDCSGGEPGASAVVDMTGLTADEAFARWYRTRYPEDAEETDERILGELAEYHMYYWTDATVQKV